MDIKKLTQKNLDYIKSVYNNKDLTWDERMKLLMKAFGKSERTVRKYLVELGFKDKNREIEESEQFKIAKEKEHDKKKKRFLISWAQNNTNIDESLLKNMEVYAKEINGEIIIIAGRYSNQTQTLDRDVKESWDPKLDKYLCASQINIHPFLSVMGDVKIQATAVSPFTGLHGLSKENSCIFGSPKSQLEMIPVLNGCKPKMMLTTGSVTVKNYTQTKLGKVSDFNHQMGFITCELKDNNIFYIRQIVANEAGSFDDLFYHVENGKITKNKEIEAAVLGDLHYGQHDEKVLNNTFKLLDKLKPKHILLHDVFDNTATSHHSQGDPYKQFALEKSGLNNLENELRNLMDGLKKFEKFENVVIVRSNHDVHLDKFLQNDWRKLPTSKNSMIYMELACMLLQQHANGNVIGVIPELINRKFPKFKTLGYNDSYVVCNWELACHGDLGISGTRPTPNSFLKLNKKMITAHTHTPKKKDGLMVVGTLTKLRLSYNLGASSWLNSFYWKR